MQERLSRVKIDMYCVFKQVLLLVIADVWNLVLTLIKCIVKVMAILEAKLHEPTNVNVAMTGNYTRGILVVSTT